MTVNRDVFLAILSMDAYNRGYGAGISQLGDDTTDSIGAATIVANAEDEEGVAEAASFYAIAYDWEHTPAAWETVIAYRGTDDILSDPIHGWGIALGSQTNEQGNLA